MKIEYKNKLIIFFSFFLLLINISVIAQQQQIVWSWVKQLGGSGWDISNGIIGDNKNHVYIGGSFTGKLKCGKKIIESKGNQDIFIARFTNKGEIEWLWKAGGELMDKITGMENAPDDDLYIAGIIEGKMKFGNTQVSGDDKKLFVARVNKNGKCDWLQLLSFSKSSTGYLLKTDLNGNLYLGGVFSDTLKCGSLKIASKGFNDIFIAQFSPNGQLNFLKNFGGKGKDQLTAITTDNYGNLYMAGNFEQELEFGNQLIRPAIKGKSSNIFLTRFDNSLKLKQVDTWYSPSYCEVTGMVINKNQNLFLTGSFSKQLQSDTLNSIAKGVTDFFVVQSDTLLKVKWIKTYGTKYETFANSILVNKFNGVMVVGSFNDTLQLDSLQLIPKGLTNNVFFAQFTSEGKFTWAENIGSNDGSSIGKGATIGNDGSLYLMGSFSGTFKSTLEEFNSFGGEDIFIAKYYNCPQIKNVINCPSYICKGSEVLLSVPNSYMDVVWNDTLFGMQKFLVNNPGTYFVKMVDINGCVVNDTINIKLAPEIKFSLGKDTAITLADNLLLKGPEHAVQYQWQDYSSDKDFLVSSPNGQPGTFEFFLSITDTAGCKWDNSINIEFYNAPDYINLSDDNNQIDLYPNPVMDVLFWQIETSVEARLTIELSDLNGKIYLLEDIQRYLPNEIRKVNMASLPTGTYCFSIIGEKKRVTAKVVKK